MYFGIDAAVAASKDRKERTEWLSSPELSVSQAMNLASASR